MANLTIPQRKALESAAKTGNAWNAWGNVYRTSTNRMMQALCARGLLTHDGRPTDKTAEALGLPVAYGNMAAGSAVVSSGLGGSTVERSSYAKDTQVVGRVMRAYQAEAVEDARQVGLSSCVPGEAATDYAHGHPSFVGRDVKIEFAHAPADVDPRTLDWSPVHEISGTLEVVWDAVSEPFPDGPVPIRELKWFAGTQVLGASPAFPNGFSDVIYFPMRKGIRRIVVRRKAK